MVKGRRVSCGLKPLVTAGDNIKVTEHRYKKASFGSAPGISMTPWPCLRFNRPTRQGLLVEPGAGEERGGRVADDGELSQLCSGFASDDRHPSYPT